MEDKSYADYQYEQFMKGVEALEAAGLQIPIKHIANSAAIAELPQYQLDMVRLGITLYGSLRQDFYHGKRKPHRYGSHRVCGRRQPASVQ